MNSYPVGTLFLHVQAVGEIELQNRIYNFYIAQVL